MLRRFIFCDLSKSGASIRPSQCRCKVWKEDQLLKLPKTLSVLVVCAAVFFSQAYNNLHQTDSAFFYLRMESALKDSIFNQNNLNKIESFAFNEQI